jgi:hypothetical protein
MNRSIRDKEVVNLGMSGVRNELFRRGTTFSANLLLSVCCCALLVFVAERTLLERTEHIVQTVRTYFTFQSSQSSKINIRREVFF